MATTYNVNFAQGGTSNITIPRTFALSGFARTESPQWNSGRADRILDTYISCRLTCSRDRNVTLNYYIESGGVILQTYNFSKEMKAGSIYNCSAGLKNFSDLTPAEVSAFIGGLSTATLTLNAGFSSGAELQLYKKGGVPFTFAIAFEDLEGSTFSLDKTEYTSGDVPILTIEPMETEGVLTHEVYWTIGDYVGAHEAVSGTVAQLAPIPDSFAALVTSVSAPMALHCITYEDGVALGERVIDVTFTARDMMPTVTVTAAPPDGGEDYWQRFDGCRLTIVCNSAHSEHKRLTITGAYAYDGDVVESVDVPVFETGGRKQFVVTYTNARDQVATATVEITVNALKAPTISVFDAQRFDGYVGDDGQTVYKWSVTSEKVRLRYAFAVDSAGGNVSPSDISLVIKAAGNTVRGTSRALTGAVEYDDRSASSADKAILNALDFSPNSAYEISFTVSDGKNTTTASVVVPKARTNLHIAASDYGIGVGCFVDDSSPENPIFRCAYPAEFVGSVKAETLTLVQPICAITWTETKNVNAGNGSATTLHELTASRDALVLFDANVSFGNNGNGRRILEIYLNGTAIRRIIFPAASGDATESNFIHILNVKQGDVLRLACWQNSGATLAMKSSARLLTLG